MHRAALVLLILFSLLISTSCSGSTAPHPTAGHSAASDQKLTVYLNDFDDLIGPMFEAASGYKIKLVQGSGAEIMSRIEAERGNPHWDVVWIDSMSSVHGLGLNDQLLEGFVPDNARHLTPAYQPLVPEQKWYYPTGAHAAGLIVYHSQYLSEDEAPASWTDLKDPRFKHAIGMPDPAIAAPAYPFVAWFYQQYGIEQGNRFFEAWFDNGLAVYPKNPNVATALLSGQIKAAALQEMNAYQLANQGEAISVVWPEEGAPAAVRVAAISKSTEKLEAAQAFINFLLDPVTQQAIIDLGDDAYHEPSVNDVRPKSDRDPDGKLLIPDAQWSYHHEAQIKQWFADYSIR